VTEDDLLGAVLDLCRLKHLHTAHFRPARTAGGWRTAVSGDGKGFPDLVIVGPRGVLFRELKAERGRTSPQQAEWTFWLRQAGADMGYWDPADLRAGLILEQLKGIA
jgi:hypothetical protein